MCKCTVGVSRKRWGEPPVSNPAQTHASVLHTPHVVSFSLSTGQWAAEMETTYTVTRATKVQSPSPTSATSNHSFTFLLVISGLLLSLYTIILKPIVLLWQHFPPYSEYLSSQASWAFLKLRSQSQTWTFLTSDITMCCIIQGLHEFSWICQQTLVRLLFVVT